MSNIFIFITVQPTQLCTVISFGFALAQLVYS